MSKKTVLFGIGLFLALWFSVTSTNVIAHKSSNLHLEYDANNQSLNATFTHNVANKNTHYIITVVIQVNGSTVLTVPYTSQPSTSSFTYNYNISANTGALISVAGTCNEAGTIVGTYTVGTGQNGTNGENAISGYFGFMIITGIFLVGFTILIEKKMKR
ncbi:hypothetical protein LCGC14_1803370 [marine sediment metagenome]|uniref:Uncharacterized protein n=1 Tax=marine sediment metagenome TaxID=412755 RepID=A0A0F9GP17_9ZZZZ